MAVNAIDKLHGRNRCYNMKLVQHNYLEICGQTSLYVTCACYVWCHVTGCGLPAVDNSI